MDPKSRSKCWIDFNLIFYIYSSFSRTDLIFFIPIFIAFEFRPNSFIFYYILHSGLLYNVYVQYPLDAFVIFVQDNTIHFLNLLCIFSAPESALSFLINKRTNYIISTVLLVSFCITIVYNSSLLEPERVMRDFFLR
jgi:hypothetical protein